MHDLIAAFLDRSLSQRFFLSLVSNKVSEVSLRGNKVDWRTPEFFSNRIFDKLFFQDTEVVKKARETPATIRTYKPYMFPLSFQ